ncbi:hypothetical protein D9M73_180480 [compost metagenome]
MIHHQAFGLHAACLRPGCGVGDQQFSIQPEAIGRAGRAGRLGHEPAVLATLEFMGMAIAQFQRDPGGIRCP